MSRYFIIGYDRKKARTDLKELGDLLSRTAKLLQGSKDVLSSEDIKGFEDVGIDLLAGVDQTWADVQHREARSRFWFFADKSDKDEFWQNLDFLSYRCGGYNRDVASSSKRARNIARANQYSSTSSNTSVAESPIASLQSSAASVSIPTQWLSNSPATALNVLHAPQSVAIMACIRDNASPSEQTQTTEDQGSTFKQMLCRFYEDGRMVVAVDNAPHREDDTSEADQSLRQLSQYSSAVMSGDESVVAYQNSNIITGASAAETINSLLSSFPTDSTDTT